MIWLADSITIILHRYQHQRLLIDSEEREPYHLHKTSNKISNEAVEWQTKGMFFMSTSNKYCVNTHFAFRNSAFRQKSSYKINIFGLLIIPVISLFRTLISDLTSTFTRILNWTWDIITGTRIRSKISRNVFFLVKLSCQHLGQGHRFIFWNGESTEKRETDFSVVVGLFYSLKSQSVFFINLFSHCTPLLGFASQYLWFSGWVADKLDLCFLQELHLRV